VFGLGEVRVTPQEDLAEAGLPAQRDGLVQVDVGPFVRGAVATAVDQEERFGGVGQRDQQGVVTPLAVVSDVHPLLALGIGRYDGAIGVEDGFLEEGGGLLGPDPQSRAVEGVHQVHDVAFDEAPAEVPGGGGVGDADGTQGVEVDLVVAPQFEVFDARAAGEDVEGDVQDVVGFVVGQVSLEDMELGVDVADEAGALCEQEHGADAAGGESLGAVGQFVVDVAGGDHGPVAFRSGAVRDAVEDALAAFSELSAVAFARRFAVAFSGLPGESGSHSKASVVWNSEDVFLPLLFQNLRGLSSFFSECEQFSLQITLG
jgi:hypothetical protein